MKPTKRSQNNPLTTNQLTGAIIDHVLRQPLSYAWRNNSTGIFDARRGIYRPAGKSGTPDIIAVSRGIFIGIEVKTGTDRLRELQKSFIASIEHAQGHSLVVHDFDDFKQKWSMVMDMLHDRGVNSRD